MFLASLKISERLSLYDADFYLCALLLSHMALGMEKVLNRCHLLLSFINEHLYMAFNKYDALSYAHYHYYWWNPQQGYDVVTIIEAVVFVFLKCQHAIQKHPLACLSWGRWYRITKIWDRNLGKGLNFHFWDLDTWISFILKAEILSVISEVRGVGSRAEHIFIFLPFSSWNPSSGLPWLTLPPCNHARPLSMYPQVTTLLLACLCVITSFCMLWYPWALCLFSGVTGGSQDSFKVGSPPSDSLWVFRMSWSEALNIWRWLARQMAEWWKGRPSRHCCSQTLGPRWLPTQSSLGPTMQGQ